MLHLISLPVQLSTLEQAAITYNFRLLFRHGHSYILFEVMLNLIPDILSRPLLELLNWNVLGIIKV